LILDGLVSSYPASARGYSVANSYLLTQPDAAMLIDTGFGKDEPVIRAQINHLSFFCAVVADIFALFFPFRKISANWISEGIDRASAQLSRSSVM